MAIKMPEPIERWVVCIAGFLEEGSLSGMQIMQNALRLKCSSAITIVLLKSWKDSMPHIAERMYNQRPVDHAPRITIIGYSYGGLSATILAGEVQKYGWDVELMFLIDPVWRWRSKRPSFLSLFQAWEIEVPTNVKRLYSWHQEVNKPQGHKLKVNPDKTEWIPQELSVPHGKMDEVEAIHERALALVCPEVKR